MIELMIYTLLFVIALIAMSVIVNKIEHAMYLRDTAAAIKAAMQRDDKWEEDLLP